MSYRIRIRTTEEDYGCPPETSLLAGMERLGRRGIPIGCRGGGCGVCRIVVESGRIRAGKMSRHHVTAADEAAGIVLACKAYPESDVTLRPIGALAACLSRGRDRPADACRSASSEDSNSIEPQR